MSKQSVSAGKRRERLTLVDWGVHGWGLWVGGSVLVGTDDTWGVCVWRSVLELWNIVASGGGLSALCTSESSGEEGASEGECGALGEHDEGVQEVKKRTC